LHLCSCQTASETCDLVSVIVVAPVPAPFSLCVLPSCDDNVLVYNYMICSGSKKCLPGTMSPSLDCSQNLPVNPLEILQLIIVAVSLLLSAC
jgi:hypothetical protein